MIKNTFYILIVFFIFFGLFQTREAQANPDYSFIGTKGCKKCHIKQFKSWAETNMAKAFDLLKPGERAAAKKNAGLDPQKDYTKDPDCLPCHVTGYGKPGGFLSLEETSDLVAVSCEMCHGAGSEYTKEQYMHLKNKEYKLSEVLKVGLVSPVTADSCTSLCHNENSPFYNKDKPFDFEKQKDEGTHQHFPLKYKHE
jgi:hypothetical protein